MAQQDKTWESAWKSALENKSITPPDGVWENIDGELHQKTSRKLAPWWWAAAAMATVLVAGVLLVDEINFEGHISNASETRLERNSPNNNGKKDETSTPTRTNPLVEGGDNEEDTGSIDVENNEEQSFSQKGILNPTVFEESGSDNSAADSDNSVAKVDKPHEVYDFLPSLLENINAKLSELTLPEIPEIWGVPSVNVNPTKKEDLSDSWFAGIDYTTGSASADGMISSGGHLQYQNDRADGYSSYNSTSETSSMSAYGMTVGKKISNKIVVESGITYRRIENSGRSNLAFRSSGGKATFNANAYLLNETVTTTSPYEVRNVHQFVSIPLKAGYLILDKKWKMAINAGVSGDYFFQTYTEDLSGNLGRYEATPADNPNWNSMIMSAVGGVNMSRIFADHYIIAISPEVRQALGDFSNTHQELKPFILQVGVKLQYKF